MSSLLGDGGVGKTALRIAQLMSCAANVSLTGEHVFVRSRVLLVSLEDSVNELRRRVKACRLRHKVDKENLKGYLFLVCPRTGRRPRVATWFKLMGVPLGNGSKLYPHGDEVQTVEFLCRTPDNRIIETCLTACRDRVASTHLD
jgi:hypothetical protein